jgi:hypothetical protein
MANVLAYLPAALSALVFVGVLFLRPRPKPQRVRRHR